MPTRKIDVTLDALALELQRLERETTEHTRNYPMDRAYAMEDGKPREGVAENERMAREKFARIREIEAVLNTHHGN